MDEEGEDGIISEIIKWPFIIQPPTQAHTTEEVGPFRLAEGYLFQVVTLISSSPFDLLFLFLPSGGERRDLSSHSAEHTIEFCWPILKIEFV